MYRERIAVFNPYRTDDLQNGAERFIGHRIRVSHGWVMDEGDAFPGEVAYIPSRGQAAEHMGWIPERDLTFEAD